MYVFTPLSTDTLENLAATHIAMSPDRNAVVLAPLVDWNNSHKAISVVTLVIISIIPLLRKLVKKLLIHTFNLSYQRLIYKIYIYL